MSCFWDAISQSLTQDEISNKLHIQVKGKKKNIIRPNAKQIATALKNKNKLITNVIWNGEEMRKLREGFKKNSPNTICKICIDSQKVNI